MNFEYFKPKTIQEAVNLYSSLSMQNKKPRYFSGGTEIITLGRLNLVYTDAVIDIKEIDECKAIYYHDDYLVMGAAASLTEVEEVREFPLLSKTVREIADRTSRNKITLGGNICGQIFYREAILPLLVTDSLVGIAGRGGVKYLPINEVFNKQILLEEGEFIFQILTEKNYLNLPFVTIKKRQQWEIGYPLITVSGIKKDQEIRFAISGLCPFPFRSAEMEREINNRQFSAAARVNNALKYVPEPILDDVEGSSEYRLFVLKNTLLDTLKELEGD
ncbi:FAD binding domain-containing protein [Lederbergia citrea]|uniref:FAD binding domain-containing protein n=1 Tax=Lederbergia citrea TaxID=2833581 RepID=UPI001BC8D270|nr:FAD binding domain-containing protein [Lederbergia citrea]MBS4205385.1 FAD binding domain-containing protein [Lederbergia citrea]